MVITDRDDHRTVQFELLLNESRVVVARVLDRLLPQPSTILTGGSHV
jgi:hypothetical protein